MNQYLETMDSIRNIFIISMIILAASVSVEARAVTKSHYTEAHHELHRLVRSTTHSHLEGFEITVPELVDVDGNHISHTMHHSRVRRNADSAPALKLTAHGQDFKITLEENSLLLSPSFAVKRIRRDATTGELQELDETSSGVNCHYTGRMVSHNDKITGISMCGDGLSGLLRTDEDDFIIEPVSPELDHSFPENQQPHIVYKRKHMGNGKQKLHYCGKQKRHPTAVSNDLEAQIRHLSDGAIVVKSPDQMKNEYEKTPTIDGVDDEPGVFERSKRSAADPDSAQIHEYQRRRVVETLVVADRQLVKNHENERVDVTTYILTVMNMVTSLFKDGTLDGNIDIVLIGITLLEDDKELRLDHRADKSLSNFCHWQSRANTTTGRKPDHSILLTGIDICIDQNAPCDTLGLAQIGGMCSRSDSCTINEDMGLGLAFTVAHETGHSFGMKHDGQGNTCSKRGGHIMSPTLNTLNGVFTWSSCSRKSLQQFLKSDHSRCLDDGQTTSSFGAPTVKSHKLPGELYSSHDQCQMQFGKGVTLCYFRHLGAQQKSVCKALWCQRSNGVCETKFMPAAEGTTCGRNMWCRRGECVSRSSSGPRAINGGWSKFGAWSECSRTCGGGVISRKRSCDSPAPQYGGRYCEGDDTIYELCNTTPCPASAKSFREQQCAEYNSRPYRKHYFTWVPYKKYWKYDLNRCELLCEAEGYNFFDRLAPQVKDGTSCDDESKDVCIAGQCTHVGCDNVLNSDATLDACGVCNGDNSTCRFVEGTYEVPVADSGYYQVTTIPQGASTIQISEIECCTHTYIAVKSASDPSRYYLNGNWRVDLYGEMNFAGAKWQYKRQPLKGEILESEGTIDEDIIIEALIVRRNPGISFRYAMKELDNALPYEPLPPAHSYAWQERRSECSKSCAGGQQDVNYICVEDGHREVIDSMCDFESRPEPQKASCNMDPCPARWSIDEWGSCSRTCGGGLQTRRVTCRRLTSEGEEYAPPSQCDLGNKPRRSQICSENECPAVWKTGVWSQCSKSCGRGYRTRTISCRSGMRKVPTSRCDARTKPHSRKSCLVSFCKRFQWFITAWGRCSATCGTGHQTRLLKCTFKNRVGRYKSVNPRKCSLSRKPTISLVKSCSVSVCPTTTTSPTTATTTAQPTTTTPEITTPLSRSRHIPRHHHEKATSSVKPPRWVAAPWATCPVTCGGSRQRRFVRCVQNGVLSNLCSSIDKPESERMCNTMECPAIPEIVEPPCEDAYKWCYLVPQHNQCSHKFFGPQCCASCKGR